jgi:hypothetical protein
MSRLYGGGLQNFILHCRLLRELELLKAAECFIAFWGERRIIAEKPPHRFCPNKLRHMPI